MGRIQNMCLLCSSNPVPPQTAHTPSNDDALHYHASQAARGTPSHTAAIALGRSPPPSTGARDSEGNKATPPSVMVASLPPLCGAAKPLANEPNATDVEPLKAGQARMESALTLILAELVKVRAENADLKSQMADLTSIVKEHRPA